MTEHRDTKYLYMDGKRVNSVASRAEDMFPPKQSTKACTVCGCTETEPCRDRCAWMSPDESAADTCSSCYRAGDQIADAIQYFKANARNPTHENLQRLLDLAVAIIEAEDEDIQIESETGEPLITAPTAQECGIILQGKPI
jgi:hypothetical protein